jgi:hypothetical protein
MCVTEVKYQRHRTVRNRKKIHASWENFWEHFSSHQWKGGEIDGRVSPRTGSTDQWVDIPGPLVGHTTVFRLVGDYLLFLLLKNLTLGGSGWDSPRLVTQVTIRFGVCHGRCSRVMARGLEMYVLDDRKRTTDQFSQDDASFQTTLFMLYIIYWAVWVSQQHTSDNRERCPRSSIPWSDTCVVQVSTTWRPPGPYPITMST